MLRAFDIDDVRWMNAIHLTTTNDSSESFFFRSIGPVTSEEKSLVVLGPDGKLNEAVNLAGIKYVLANSRGVQAQLLGKTLQPVYDSEIQIFRNPKALPRAFWVPSFRWADSDNEAVRLMSATDSIQQKKLF